MCVRARDTSGCIVIRANCAHHERASAREDVRVYIASSVCVQEARKEAEVKADNAVLQARILCAASHVH